MTAVPLHNSRFPAGMTTKEQGLGHIYQELALVTAGCGFLYRSGCRYGLDGSFGLVDCGVELHDVLDLDPAFGGNDDDGWGFLHVEFEAEFLVGVDFPLERAIGVEDEGHGLAVGLEEVVSELLEVVLAVDAVLRGENLAAVVGGEVGGDFVLQIARIERGLGAPDVAGDLEIVAHEGDVVLLERGVDDGEGARAGGALEVFPLDDGDLGAGGGLEHGGVFEGGHLSADGGLGGERGRRGGGGERQKQSSRENSRHNHRTQVQTLCEQNVLGFY